MKTYETKILAPNQQCPAGAALVEVYDADENGMHRVVVRRETYRSHTFAVTSDALVHGDDLHYVTGKNKLVKED